MCAGKDRYLKKFCSGIHVPDNVIRNWGELPGNIYIRKETDALGKATFKYVRESTWLRTNKKRDPPRIDHAPKLNLENYPYKDHLFCAECGARLSRYIRKDQRTVWFCSTKRKRGKAACDGIRVPDEVIRSWGEIKFDIYIKGEGKSHGKRSYSYSRHKVSKGKGNT